MGVAGVTLLLDVSPIESLSVKVTDILLDIPLVEVIIMDEMDDLLPDDDKLPSVDVKLVINIMPLDES